MITQLSAAVAHHLELELLPAGDRLLDQDLADRAGREAEPRRGARTARRVGDAGAPATEDVRRAGRSPAARRRRRRARASSSVWAIPDAGTSSPIPTIACLNRSRSSAVAIASASAPIISGVPGTPITPRLVQGHREVQPGLAAERRQHGVGLLALDDPRHDLRRQRLDVGPIGEVRVGHDRRRVRVDEHDPVALVAQHAAGLRARVVELARLPDHDRPRADDQDRVRGRRAAASGDALLGLAAGPTGSRVRPVGADRRPPC